MKWAIVNEQRLEAQSDLSGICPACKSPMVAKCGDVRVYHWAHRGRRDCDKWWESETEWHRNWKNKFPSNWQEVVHPAENGEKHIADVKTDQGWVLEFQHSKINPDERKAREAFYQKLVWIVDGTRRKNDKAQFFRALEGRRLNGMPFDMWKIPVMGEGALLRDWAGSNLPVLFDFYKCDKPENPYLWCLVRVVNGMAYVGPFPRDSFIKHHGPEAKANKLDFSELLKNINEGIEIINQPRKVSSFDPLTAMLQRQGLPRRMRRL